MMRNALSRKVTILAGVKTERKTNVMLNGKKCMVFSSSKLFNILAIEYDIFGQIVDLMAVVISSSACVPFLT